jgi:hypothetical protein
VRLSVAIRVWPALAALACVSQVSPASAQAPVRPLFGSGETLELRITASFRELIRSGDDRPEFDGMVEIDDATAGPIALPVEIRVRGVSRLANCDFPPLRIDFAREGVAGTVFAGQNNLKLVTLCKRGTDYREYLALELLIYRMFNVLTEHSYRVRPANIEFVYSDARRAESYIEPAFFIEERWEAAERLGLEPVEADSVSIASLEPEHTALLTMFQFLIGNTDWSMLRGPVGEACCHNVTPFDAASGERVVLPYDFDQSGLIDTEYAVPSPQVRVRSVRDRVYRGFCSMNDRLDSVVEHFNAERASLEALLNDETISEKGRRRALDYVDSFFEIVNDPDRSDVLIAQRCRD